jgi:hypothetical protein
MSKM